MKQRAVGNHNLQAVGQRWRIERIGRQPRRRLSIDPQLALDARHFVAAAGKDAVDAVALETIDRHAAACQSVYLLESERTERRHPAADRRIGRRKDSQHDVARLERRRRQA